jgi:hypothetical protein
VNANCYIKGLSGALVYVITFVYQELPYLCTVDISVLFEALLVQQWCQLVRVCLVKKLKQLF